MEDSILETIKKLLGAENIDEFDENIILFINGSINVLTENGVGDPKGFRITGDAEIWSDFITNDNPMLFELCKEFIYFRVKLAFDPPSIGSLVAALKEQIQEDLWRIREQAEPADYFETKK